MYDYIVTGAGSAGCVIASRLTEDPNVKVLLLEAGGRDINPMIHMPGGVGKLFGPRVNWRFFTAPQAHLDDRAIWYPQGRTLGGSSSINAMIYIRGQKEDYDNWEALGNTGWSYADLLPYFRKSEDNERLVDAYHGQGGPLWVSDQIGPYELSRAFVRSCQAWGLPYNPDFNGASQVWDRVLPGHVPTRPAPQRGRLLPPAGAWPAQSDRADPCACSPCNPREGARGWRRDRAAAHRDNRTLQSRGHCHERGHKLAAPAHAVRHRQPGRTPQAGHHPDTRTWGRGQKPPGPPLHEPSCRSQPAHQLRRAGQVPPFNPARDPVATLSKRTCRIGDR